jgi:hypothetical protein
LVLATVDRENLKDISFPAHEEAHRPGYDGRTFTEISTPRLGSTVNAEPADRRDKQPTVF